VVLMLLAVVCRGASCCCSLWCVVALLRCHTQAYTDEELKFTTLISIIYSREAIELENRPKNIQSLPGRTKEGSENFNLAAQMGIYFEVLQVGYTVLHMAHFRSMLPE
jgi:hypothetical protein